MNHYICCKMILGHIWIGDGWGFTRPTTLWLIGQRYASIRRYVDSCSTLFYGSNTGRNASNTIKTTQCLCIFYRIHSGGFLLKRTTAYTITKSTNKTGVKRYIEISTASSIKSTECKRVFPLSLSLSLSLSLISMYIVHKVLLSKFSGGTKNYRTGGAVPGGRIRGVGDCFDAPSYIPYFLYWV